MVRLSIAAALLFATAALSLTPIDAGAGQVGAGKEAQFTGGGCVADADCSTSCCAGGATSKNGTAVGICSNQGAGVEFGKGKTGCGFVDPNAAQTVAAAKAQVALQGFRRVVRAGVGADEDDE